MYCKLDYSDMHGEGKLRVIVVKSSCPSFSRIHLKISEYVKM